MKLTLKGLYFLTGIFVVAFLLAVSLLIRQIQQPLLTTTTTDRASGLLDLLFYFLAAFISGMGGLLASISSYRRKIRERAAIEWVENYIQGAVKEKVIHRELKEWEKFLLEEKYKESKNRNFDLDRRSPVFRIQGGLVKLEPMGNETVRLSEEWDVRGFKLREENFPDIRWKTFKEGEEVAVEFSPFSKWVWDVYKIVSGKRKWLMGLSNENWQFLAEGKLRVVPRAPYGTHRLEEIKRGDLICFSNSGTGRTIDIVVEYVKHYKVAEELLKSEGVENVFPQAASFEEAVKMLNSIEDYEKRIQKGGIYAIGVRLLNDRLIAGQ